MSKLQLFVLLAIYVQNSSCFVNRLYETGSHLWNLYILVDDIQLRPGHKASDVYDIFSHAYPMFTGIRTEMATLSSFFDLSASDPKIISDSFGSVSSNVMLRKDIDMIVQSIRSINNCYEDFRKHMKPSRAHTEEILTNLTRNIIVTVEGKIEVIRNKITDGRNFVFDNKTLLSAIAREAQQQYNVICDYPQTISGMLVHLFQMIMVAELKVDAMMVFVNTYRYSSNEGWKVINKLAREQFEKQFALYTLAFQKYVSETESIYLRRCDPADGWEEGVNFVQLEETIQNTIFQYDRSACNSYTCNEMRKDYPETCVLEDLKSRTACTGISSSCFGLDSIDACAVDSGYRKFQWINSSLDFYGTLTDCREGNNFKVGEWGTGRATCTCKCFKSHKISVEFQESDWRRSKVVTGIRFVRQNNILHIQMREGHLTRDGFVYGDSLYTDGWLPLPSDPAYKRVDINTRSFFLDDLHLPPGNVLTGLNFIQIIRGDVSGFALKIHGRPFHFDGQPLGPKINHFSLAQRGKGLTYKNIRSDNTRIPHKVTPKDIAYVTLDVSDFKHDVGQTTLPFFDTIPVTTTPISGLGGVGLFHKAAEGYAGTFSLRLFPMAYSQHLAEFNNRRVVNGTVIFNSPNANSINDYA